MLFPVLQFVQTWCTSDLIECQGDFFMVTAPLGGHILPEEMAKVLDDAVGIYERSGFSVSDARLRRRGYRLYGAASAAVTGVPCAPMCTHVPSRRWSTSVRLCSVTTGPSGVFARQYPYMWMMPTSPKMST